ncbi:MAG: ABC transporter permease, partial [Reyranella sp.]|nr:ABC transporter permease [Reyranella sp.]
MLAYTLRRIAQLVPVVLMLTVAVFAFVEALPGSIVDTLIGTEGGDVEEARAILTKEYGLDRPVYERYALWLVRTLQFDFGNSLVTRRPISTELLSRIPATVYLAVVGIVLSIVIAVPLGTLAAVRRNSAVDYTAQVTSLAGISIPEFWFAILCVLLFSLHLGWLPSSGYVSPLEDFWGSLQFLILPAAAIGFRQAA